jgi:hypothetical protein
MRTSLHRLLAPLMIVGLAGVATAQKKEFTNWPAGTSPQEVGKKIVQGHAAALDSDEDPRSTTPRTPPGMPRWSSPS